MFGFADLVTNIAIVEQLLTVKKVIVELISFEAT